MNKKKIEKFLKSKLFFILVIIVIVPLVTAGVWAATNIGTDIDTDGNLTVSGMAGIKSATPSFDLDVNGNARITNNNFLYFGGTGALDTTGSLQHDGTDFIFSTPIMPTGYKSSGGSPGITIGVTVKDGDGNNCALFFSDGLLIVTDCPPIPPPT
ncbi:MAG: hypothetical protein WC460_00520 [Patescibacteria group bacterium]